MPRFLTRFDALRGVDLFNVLISSVVLTYNTAFIPNGSWLQPNSILRRGTRRISAEFAL